MTNEEIKKALDKELRCAEYAQEEYADCVKVSLLENSLNLIISQEQEIEMLKEENKPLNGIHDEIYKEVEDNIRAEIANGGTSCHWCEDIICKKAVKEFAKKLKEKAFNKDMFNDWAGATYVVLVRDIDELLKQYGVEVEE